MQSNHIFILFLIFFSFNLLFSYKNQLKVYLFFNILKKKKYIYSNFKVQKIINKF